jgi:hypothetical protein
MFDFNEIPLDDDFQFVEQTAEMGESDISETDCPPDPVIEDMLQEGPELNEFTQRELTNYAEGNAYIGRLLQMTKLKLLHKACC